MGSITHSKVSAQPDSGNPNLVNSTDWNQTHTFSLDKTDVGLANVDNTSDMMKPVSTAQAAAINDAANSPILTITDASYTVVPSTDAGKYIRFTSSSAKTCTFNGLSGLVAGMEFHITNRAFIEYVTLAVVNGVVLRPPKGGSLKLGPNDTVTVKIVSPLEGDVMGSTELP